MTSPPSANCLPDNYGSLVQVTVHADCHLNMFRRCSTLIEQSCFCRPLCWCRLPLGGAMVADYAGHS